MTKPRRMKPTLDLEAAIQYLEAFSKRAVENAREFEDRYGPTSLTDHKDQVQRKKIYGEIAYMLAGALRAASQGA